MYGRSHLNRRALAGEMKAEAFTLRRFWIRVVNFETKILSWRLLPLFWICIRIVGNFQLTGWSYRLVSVLDLPTLN